MCIVAAAVAISAIAVPKIDIKGGRVVSQGDSLMIIVGSDTAFMASGAALSAALGDTLWDAAGATSIENENTDAYDIATLDKEREMARLTAVTVQTVVVTISIALLGVVFLVLLFMYLRHRAKCKVIRQAIDARYELPQGIFGGNTYVTNYGTPQPAAPAAAAPAQVPTDGATPPPLPGEDPQAGAVPPAAPFTAATGFNMDWALVRGPITTLAVGVGLMLFFLIAGAKEVAAVMLIPALIGGARLFVVYQNQKQAQSRR